MLTRLAIARAAGGPLRLLAVGVAIVLAGCGGSAGNGVASRSAGEILAASRAAAERASAVHVVSHSSVGPLSLVLNLDLRRGGGRGDVTLRALSFEVIRIGNILYLKGNRAFDQNLRSTTGLRASPGRWLETPADTAQLAQLASLTSLPSEIGRLLASAGPITKRASTTVNGRKAIELEETGRLVSGALYIATTGEPYPLQMVRSGGESGQTTFSGWNNPVALSAPANAIASSQSGHERH